MQTNTERVATLLAKKWGAKELGEMNDEEFLIANWKENGVAIIMYIDTLKPTPKTMKTFLTHCTPCGGNWGGMLLTGIKELYPTVWNLIPNYMGTYAFNCISIVLNLLNITSEE
jgi:hypothetical protein